MTAEEDPSVEDTYDELAATYHAAAEANPFKAHLEFPATTSLVPGVAGHRVLDVGCGTGRYAEWLVDRGADVVGVDVSTEMIAQARERLGDEVEFHATDVEGGLEFASTEEFDGIVSGVALDYVGDWHGVFEDFSRILRPGGFVVCSVRHPLSYEGETDYFGTTLRPPDYEVGVPYYHRPFSEVFRPLLEASFRLEEVVEPRPTDEFPEGRSEEYERASRRPVFLCFRAVEPHDV